MKQTPIKWGEIIAETGNYRDGFVAIFRKYEGQVTDEKDGQGRTVKVTVESFARHMGVHPDTFRRWTKTRSAQAQPRSANDLGRDVTRAARNAPDAVVTGIMNAPEATQNAILDALASKIANDRIGKPVPIPSDSAIPDSTKVLRNNLARIGQQADYLAGEVSVLLRDEEYRDACRSAVTGARSRLLALVEAIDSIYGSPADDIETLVQEWAR